VGDAAERPQRNFTRALRDSLGLARRDRAGIREEDGENAAERDRHGVIPREVGSMKEVEKMPRISDLHKEWMKEPKYRKAYSALEEEFVLASVAIDLRSRRSYPGRTGPEDGDYAACSRPTGRRARAPVDAHAGSARESDRIAFDRHLRADISCFRPLAHGTALATGQRLVLGSVRKGSARAGRTTQGGVVR
jgi:hypothetical protein